MAGTHLVFFSEITLLIADVAATKRHQRLDKIRIIFTCTSFKSCFQKSSVMQFTPLTLYKIQFAQHTIARLLWMRTFYTTYACMKCMHTGRKQLCWFQYNVGKKCQAFSLSLMVFPYSNICYSKGSQWKRIHNYLKMP